MIKIKQEREKILDRELQKHIEKKAILEVEKAYQETLDPSEMSAKKPLKFGANGQPISWREISRKEHIELLIERLESEEVIIKTINDLY